jgi:manganese transport protein
LVYGSGNWATDIAGGSQFGYALLWVLLMSNIMALLLQSLSARLGIVTQRDLRKPQRNLFAIYQLYIVFSCRNCHRSLRSCRGFGMAIGINLLFDIPLIEGVLIVLDTFCYCS